MNEWTRLQQQFDALDGVTLKATKNSAIAVHVFQPVSDFYPKRAVEFHRLATHAAEQLSGDNEAIAERWYEHVLRNCRKADFTVDGTHDAMETGNGTEQPVTVEFLRIDNAGRVCGDAAGVLARSSATPASAPVNATPKPVRVSLDEQALAMFLKMKDREPDIGLKRLAELMGRNDDGKGLTPSRCPKLANAMRTWNAKPSMRRGTKDKNRNIEAEDAG